MSEHKPMPVIDDRDPQPEHPPRANMTNEPAQVEGQAQPRGSDAPDPGTHSAVTVDQVKLALRKVKDPELNLNILDLGLVYAIDVDGSTVKVDMSLTSPGCPSGPEIMTNAEQTIRAIPGVSDVTINLVWTPYWTPDRIEPRIRAYLGL
jgi:metal-sulfur cluster biosynthetic enzyme